MSLKNLILHKASAGSGKTYALARRFITFLLCVKEKGIYRLRNDEEIPEAVRCILAVTFTNKATAEMKERIVDRLAELASDTLPDKEVEYLQFFMKRPFAFDREKLRAVSRKALQILLNNYSDFQVSTIDSFFQTVLRTFAYEAELTDGFELELDSDFVARSAVDATISDMRSNQAAEGVSVWLRRLMREQMQRDTRGWNIFEQSVSPNSGSTNLYTRILDVVGKVDAEEYKAIKHELEEWFVRHRDFMSELDALEDRMITPVREMHRELLERCKEVKSKFANPCFDGLRTRGTGPATLLRDVLNSTPTCLKTKTSPVVRGDAAIISKFFNKTALAQVAATKEFGELMGAAVPFYELLAEWYETINKSSFRLWQIYSQNLKYLWLMTEFDRRATEIVEQNNLVRISDTNLILRRIIGEDEVPFVYERLGARIDHFLIDEFQDTSSMQWQNFKPLLSETLSHAEECDSLLIGDVKQSIYRFRNADPTVISRQVPEAFADRIRDRDEASSENVNYRSAPLIVRFNNSFFTRMAEYMDSLEGEDSRYFRTLYGEVAQMPLAAKRLMYAKAAGKPAPKTGPKGYVEMRGLAENPVKTQAQNVVQLVAQLLDERGWQKRDITIQVRKNFQITEIIQAMMEHNARIDRGELPGCNKMTFVSEESLLVSSSRAVKAVVAVLRLLSQGVLTRADLREPAEKQEDTAANPRTQKMTPLLYECRFLLFALKHPGHTPGQLLAMFQADNEALNMSLEKMLPLRGMALPQLVERIIHDFLQSDGEKVPAAEAPYLAAFQDAVLDYTEFNPTDLATFLQWWDAHASKLTISSSRGADDITLMTIHKAKGLEFPVTIIYDLEEQFGLDVNPVKNWMWIKPDAKALLDDPEADLDMLPPYIPVYASEKDLDLLSLAPYIRELRTKMRMDYLNLLYVAFTRAGSELYIFPKRPKQKDGYKLINEILLKMPTSTSATDWLMEPGEQIPASMLESEEDSDSPIIAAFGCKLSAAEIADIRKKHDADSVAVDRLDTVLDDYYVRNASEFLRFVAPETDEARVRGEVLHSIMQDIKVADDLRPALKRARVRGHINSAQEQEYYAMLAPALADPRFSPWFAPGLRVFNERTLRNYNNRPSKRNQRPDRVIIDPEGNLTVIDFKFGEVEKTSAYTSQVSSYMKDLRTALPHIRSVKGFVWYVTKSDFDEV